MKSRKFSGVPGDDTLKKVPSIINVALFKPRLRGGKNERAPQSLTSAAAECGDVEAGRILDDHAAAIKCARDSTMLNGNLRLTTARMKIESRKQIAYEFDSRKDRHYVRLWLTCLHYWMAIISR